MKVLLIVFLLMVLKVGGAVSFTAPKWCSDLCLSIPTFQDAIAEPLDLPRATSYFVQTSEGVARIEDRFNTFDMWCSLTVRACWRDSVSNRIIVARFVSPAPGDDSSVQTRHDFYAELPPLNVKDRAAIDDAVICCTPLEADVGCGEKPRRSQRKNLIELYYHPSPNERFHVFSFRPRSPERKEKTPWYMVAFEIAPGQDVKDAKERFEADFLDKMFVPLKKNREPKEFIALNPKALPAERDIFISDLSRSVANYLQWSCVSEKDVVVLDDLGDGTREMFLEVFTNSIPKVRAKYAELVPSPLDSTNHLAVVRAFRDRTNYLNYAGADKEWTAALWSPEHRELILCLADTSTDELLKTARHELFHHYLTYAAALVETAAWFNEGHAELFANSHIDREGNVVFDKPSDNVAYIKQNIETLGRFLPSMFDMDYKGFYGGDSLAEIRAKYYLAWSMAYFLEVGAPKMRFQPFKNLRGDYVKELVKTRSTADATRAVFTDEIRNLFVYEWIRFWNKQ